MINPGRLSDYEMEGQLDLISFAEAQTIELPPSVPSQRRDIEAMIQEMKRADHGVVAFDTETTGLSILNDAMVGASFAYRINGDMKGYYLIIAHDRAPQIPGDMIVPVFLALQQSNLVIGHNLPFDLRQVAVILGGYQSVDGFRQVYDTYWAASGLNQERPGGNGLKSLTEKILLKDVSRIDEIMKPNGQKRIDIRVTDPIKLAEYAIDDAVNTYLLWEHFRVEQERENLANNFQKMKMPFLKMLVKMQLFGIRVDMNRFDYFQKLYDKEFYQARKQIEELDPALLKNTKNKIVLDSPIALGKRLFEPPENGGLGIPMLRDRTMKSNNYDTSETHLKELAINGNELCNRILNYRKYAKLKSTYSDGYIPYITEENRIHAEWNGAKVTGEGGDADAVGGTATGRLSSSNPNLQNVPATKGENIRNIFVPDPGYKFWIGDQGQLEYRIMAALTGEPVYVEAFKKGYDPHIKTAAQMGLFQHPLIDERLGNCTKDVEDSTLNHRRDALYRARALDEKGIRNFSDSMLEVFGPSWKDVQDVLSMARQIAKNCGFGALYGAGPTRLMELINGSIKDPKNHITIEQAKERLERFFSATTKLRTYINQIHNFARKYGYVKTICGFKRTLTGIYGTHQERAKALRESFNTLIQGSAADLMMCVMLRVEHDPLLCESSRILLQIHDEIVAQIPEECTDEHPIPKRIEYHMRHPFGEPHPLLVPLEVDWKLTERWQK